MPFLSRATCEHDQLSCWQYTAYMIKFGDGSRTPTIIERDHLFPIEDNLLRSLISSPLARIMRCGRFCIYDGGFQSQTALVAPAGAPLRPSNIAKTLPSKVLTALICLAGPPASPALIPNTTPSR